MSQATDPNPELAPSAVLAGIGRDAVLVARLSCASALRAASIGFVVGVGVRTYRRVVWGRRAG